MIVVYVFRNQSDWDASELIAVVPFDSFTGWFKEHKFDLSCSYTIHFQDDGKVIEDL